MSKSKSSKNRSRHREGSGGPLLLYGRHTVLAALANPSRRCLRVLAAQDLPDSAIAELESARGASASPHPRIERVERSNLSALLGKDARHQGLVLETRALTPVPLETLTAPCAARGDNGQTGPLIALDQVTDPRNVGAVFRSAAAFGALGVLLQSRHAPAETGALARAASGGLEHVPRIEVTNLARALAELKSAGWWVLGLAEEATQCLQDFGPETRIVIVLGAEGAGLRRLTREACDLLVRLPTVPTMPSLNVSNAAAVALYALHPGAGQSQST